MFKYLILLNLLITAIALPAQAAPGDHHFVKPLQAGIYESPGDGGKPKFIIAIGRKLIEFDRRDGWIHVGVVHTGGHTGWIKKTDTSRTDPDGLIY